MKTICIGFLVCGVALAQTPAKSTTATKSTATKSTAASKTGAAKSAPAPAMNLLDPSTMKRTAPAMYKVKFVTTKGDVVIDVTRAWAPRGADRFYNLVRGGFFTNAAFFRVLSGFMAQFGMSARPDVSRVWANANIADDPVVKSNKRGFLTFANTGMPNSRATQLFINYGDNSRLDADRFAPFGEVVEGMDVVDKFYSGYGEGPPGGRGPDQGRVQSEGKAYLDKNFPLLDRIISATIVPAAPPAGAAAPAATGTAAPKPPAPKAATPTK